MVNLNVHPVAGQIQPIRVPFHGSDLYLVNHDGQPYTPLRSIVEGMGLDWASQFTKVKNRFKSCIVEIAIQLPGDTQRRNVLCFLVRMLPGWLYTINAGKVASHLREKVLQYQAECSDVLWKYWTDGVAVNPRVAYSVGENDRLSKAQQDILRGLVEGAASRLPRDKRAKAIVGMWSRLKAHFKVPYREIPQSEFTEAISIVQRATVEWEVVNDEPMATGDLANKDYVRRAREAYRALDIRRPENPEQDQLVADGFLAHILADRLWQVGLGVDGRISMTPIPKDVMMITRERIHEIVGDPSSLALSYLPAIITACLRRLESKLH